MRKLFVLIKKEIRELLTPQMIVPLLAVVLVFSLIGNVVGKESKKNQGPQPIEILDLDNSAASQQIINIISKNNLVPDVTHQGDAQSIVNLAKQKNEKAALVIPEGFEAGLNSLQPQKIQAYTIISSFAYTSLINTAYINSAFSQINEKIGNQILAQKNSDLSPQIIKQPVAENDFVVIGNRQANISPAAVSGFVTSQTVFIPILMIIIIIMSSQIIVTSVASEKENKTLETLLSTPVRRQYIVAAKLLGAGAVALLMAVVYMIGMRNYLGGMMSLGGQTAASVGASPIFAQLGLTFTTADYFLLGISLFFGILSALSIAIILGVFAEDTKSAQGVVAPLMILILLPYFLTTFLDISTLSPAIKWIIYAIPFSHPFLASSDILLGRTQNVWYGIAYMAVFFLVFVYIAARIFASDKIFTMKLNFKRKR